MKIQSKLPDVGTTIFTVMSKMATDIFLKGYQWPFDPQRIEKSFDGMLAGGILHEIKH